MSIHAAWTESLPGLTASANRPTHVTLGCSGENLPLSRATPPEGQSDGRQEGLFCSDTSITVTFAEQPTAIYESFDMALSGLPKARKRAYFALTSSWLHYCTKQVIQGQLPAIRSYSYHILLSCAHPLSSYPHILSAHLRDVTKSFVDLHTLAQERWSLDDNESQDSCLPWHLGVIRLLSDFELESLF